MVGEIMGELGPKNFSTDIGPDGNFINKTSETAERPNNPEIESSVDFAQIERSLSDGTAGEYINNVGALPMEGLLEEQGDERVWPEISAGEQEVIRGEFTRNVDKYNLRQVEDGRSLMAFAA